MSDSLPAGTVTFMFSDIEGSTRLLTTLGGRYATLLARHHALVREQIAAHHGVEVKTEGDAFFVVFTSASAALAFAAAAQRALAGEAWPAGADVRVRMGIHTGEGALSEGDYVGLDVHRAARVSAAAHGGQVLVSDAQELAFIALQQLADAARLLGAMQAVRDRGEPFLTPAEVIGLPDPDAQVRAAMSESDFRSAWEEGRRWPIPAALLHAAGVAKPIKERS